MVYDEVIRLWLGLYFKIHFKMERLPPLVYNICVREQCHYPGTLCQCVKRNISCTYLYKTIQNMSRKYRQPTEYARYLDDFYVFKFHDNAVLSHQLKP